MLYRHFALVCLLMGGMSAQAEEAPQKKDLFQVLSDTAQKGQQAFCSTFCGGAVLGCKIKEVQDVCVQHCDGVRNFSGLGNIDLKPCRKQPAKPFVEVAKMTRDGICDRLCNRISCKTFAIGGLVWNGKQYVFPACDALCRSEKIVNCRKAAESSPDRAEKITPEEREKGVAIP